MISDLLISTQAFDYDRLEEIFGRVGRVYRNSREVQPDPHMPELQIETDIGMFRFEDYDPTRYQFYEMLNADIANGDAGPETLAMVAALGKKPYFLLFSYDSWQLGVIVVMRFPVKGMTLIQSEIDGMIRPIEEVQQNIQARGGGEIPLGRRR